MVSLGKKTFDTFHTLSLLFLVVERVENSKLTFAKYPNAAFESSKTRFIEVYISFAKVCLSLPFTINFVNISSNLIGAHFIPHSSHLD